MHLTYGRVDCSGEYSFVPQSEKAYIIRYSFLQDRCMFELFRVVPGGDPIGEPLTHEEPQVCFGK